MKRDTWQKTIKVQSPRASRVIPYQNGERHLHIFHSDIFQDLAIVDIPDGLVVPHLGCEQYGAKNDALPVGRRDIDFRVRQQPASGHENREPTRKCVTMRY